MKKGELLMSEATENTTQEQQTTLDEYDVAILGGGQAGLTLALQIKQTRPETSIVVIEKQRFPVPEAAHKVGESTVEIMAHYLRDILGLQEHLQTQQLRKFGLRMFFSAAGNQDITHRVEYGQIAEAPLPSYQLDRGRFENTLSQLLPERGITLLDGTKVQQIDLQPQSETHHLRLDGEQGEREINVKWVVDASGRSSLLKRQLGLAKKVGHHANSAWFRVNYAVDINDWSDDPEWKGRVTNGERRLSTNHLMGPGYWIWLIPLSSNSTSIGIVADAEMHPFEGFNLFERALSWLHEREPQLAQVVEEHREQIQDFRVMRDYSYSCEQVYSEERWCLTGEAAVAIDPLYSPGGDLIAIGNGLTCDLVTRYLDGEDIEDLAAAHNQIFLIFSEVWLVAYEKQYPLMSNAQVMVAKVIWDTIIYWAFPGLLFFHDKIRRLGDSDGALANLYRCWNLHTRVQQFFREWHSFDQPEATDTFADPYSLMDFLVDLHNGMAANLPDDELEAQFAINARLLEQLSGQLVQTVIDKHEGRVEDEAAQEQIRKWREEPFIAEVLAIYEEEQRTNPIDNSWITLGYQSEREKQEITR
ncbi:halogenase [Ktedonospora formicarum]|uniref:Halogenase n=2 Tax=Ktedonospora formicarum TaxID=2778364 RepID=A0A8J3I5Z7_9CHLR|nr:halogenase [Ktedonospora formicarum]